MCKTTILHVKFTFSYPSLSLLLLKLLITDDHEQNNPRFNKLLPDVLTLEDLLPKLRCSENGDLKLSESTEREDDSKKPRSETGVTKQSNAVTSKSYAKRRTFYETNQT